MMRIADDDALTRRQPVRLDDHRHAEARQLFAHLVERPAQRVGSRRNLLALHKNLGEGLAGLKLRGCLGGAEDAQASLLQLVDQAE